MRHTLNDDKKIRGLYAKWLSILPVKKNKVVFSQFGGKGYGCNPKAICDEFLKRDEKYDLVWILGASRDRNKENIPEGVRTVSGIEAIKELMTAKVWINNIHFNTLIEKGLKKKKQTIYLNTYHAGLSLKHQVNDKNNYNNKKEISQKEKKYRIDGQYVDYISCGYAAQRHALEVFFYGNGEIVNLGNARTDVIVNGSEEIRNKVRKFYKIGPETNIITYAPTFRSDMKLHWYDLQYEKIIKLLEDKTGEEWVMLIRLHPRLEKKTKKIMPKSSKFINAGAYPDMQDLIVASEMMISDYSSVITDFMLSKRPMFMYVPDLDQYLEKRGLYYTMEELPFPYATTTDALSDIIQNFDEEKYVADVDAFIDKLGCYNDGNASKRTVDFLISKMQEKR